jgi:hypothetical protein
VTPCCPAGCPACQTTLPLLDFFCPTTQSQTGGSVCRRRIPPPPRTACGVWLPPARHPPPVLPTRQACRSVHGLHPSRISPHRDRCSSRSPCPPAVTWRTAPPRRKVQATRPASGPCSRDESVLPPEPLGFQPSIPSWGSTLQSVLPLDLVLALVAAPPLSPLGGLTSKSAWTSGSRGANESGDPSPDHQLSWASLPSDCLGAPFIVPRGGLMVSPHARPAFPRIAAIRAPW